VIEVPVTTARDSAAATGAAAIAVAAAPAMTSGAMNFSFAIIISGLPLSENLNHLDSWQS
jgi:hypothetical protein